MFCYNCGKSIDDNNFCANCGTKMNTANQQSSSSQNKQQSYSSKEIDLWEGKPSGIVDSLKEKANLNPITYRVTNQRIIISGGILGNKNEEVELRHVKDIRVTQTLVEKLSNYGDIQIISTDYTVGNFVLKNVSNPIYVKDIIRNALMDLRDKMNIIYKENL